MVACDECAGYIGVPKFEEYYHGYIDRNEAERRLKARGIPNSYLLRLSRTPAVNDKWETIYVLSYLSSALLCYHFKLVPRLNCFQLGGRLFDCLQGCLSRYYIHDIMTGERLRHPVPPCSPPLEFYTQRLRAVQTFEPNNATEQLGCSVGDRFLLVSDDTKSDWVFVTSLKTRHSGYLPRCCIEKEYPDLIERLEFFHPDASITSTKELLKRAGACSYLLRPSDSRPGLYTLLLYDGNRVRKYRLELVVQSEEISCLNTPVGNQGNDTHHAGYQRRCSVPIAVSTTDSGIKGSDENLSTTNPCHTSEDALTVCQTVADGIADYDHSQQDTVFPMYSTTTKVMYNGVSFPSVEAVVAAIEAYPGWWHPEPTPSLSRPIEDGSGNRLIESTGTDGSDLCPYLSGTSQSGEPGVPGPPNTSVSCQPHLFKPVCRELKPQLNTASPPIYMLLRYAQQLPTQTGVLEIHGEMSMLVAQRKKWKSHYAQLDRRQGILTLRDGEKRKTERFDLSKCVYYPVHSLMYDRAYCFGLILYGASLGDKEDIVFSVDAPLLQLCPSCFSSSVPSVANNSVSSRSAPAFGLTELDPSTYAGRPEEVLSSVLLPTFLESGRTHSVGDLSVQLASHAGSNDTSSPTCSCSHVRAVSQEVVYDRWLRCIRLHCRNTRVDACNEEDCDRRQTVLRCHRTLEVKMNNAKLLPATTCKSRRDESIYVISLDGIEVARAYPGSSTVHILLDDFPFGFKKVEVWAREENKRKRSVAMDLELSQFNSALSDSEDSCQPIVNHDSSVGDADTGSHPSSSSICTVREGIYNLGAITYKELHVLPFTHYERFREIMRTCLDSELVPLCIFVWQNLPNESSSRTSFLSSLLLTTIELKCHLKLVLSLLRADIMPQNPTDAFRGNTLGTQILDQYSNIVCTEWRNQCFKRVREEASNSAPSSISSAGSHLVKSLSGLSIDHLPAGPNVQKTSGRSCLPTPGLAHSSSNNVVGADDAPGIADQTNQIGSPSFDLEHMQLAITQDECFGQ